MDKMRQPIVIVFLKDVFHFFKNPSIEKLLQQQSQSAESISTFLHKKWQLYQAYFSASLEKKTEKITPRNSFECQREFNPEMETQ
jgi:hypothetical protein